MIKRTAIVILNYKNFQDTINCIESIYMNSIQRNFTIIVVDNASGNNSLENIDSHFKSKVKTNFWNNDFQNLNDIECLLIQNSTNNGYAYGNNVGLQIAYNLGFKYLMVLNNDTIFIEETLTKLIEELERNQNILCTGPLLLKGDKINLDYNCAKRRPTLTDIFRLSYFGHFFKTDVWEKKYYYLKRERCLDKILEVDIISGSCMLFKAEELAKIDFFDENTFLYYEEAIIHEKARLNGLKLVLVPYVKVIHLGAQSTKTQSTSVFTLKCELESLKYYLREYRGLSNLSVFLVSFSQFLFLELYKLCKNKR